MAKGVARPALLPLLALVLVGTAAAQSTAPSSGAPVSPSGLTFSASTGVHTGTFNGVQLPSVRGPSAAPLLGTVGYATDGRLIYGPFEAGFGSSPTATSAEQSRPPFPCKSGSTYSGYCPGGMDVGTCEESLFKTCPSKEAVTTSLFMDSCGGHAQPYHYHTDMVCHYDQTAAGHSTLIGVMLDGRNLYGRYEATGTLPTDLDACGGHVGDVPANAAWNIPARTRVYHYHAQTKPPFLLGCYGPVADVSECRSLYSAADPASTVSSPAPGGGPVTSLPTRPTVPTAPTGGSLPTRPTVPTAPTGAPTGDSCKDFKPCADGSRPNNMEKPPKCADGSEARKPPSGCMTTGRHLLQMSNTGSTTGPSTGRTGGCDGLKSQQMGASYSVPYDLWCPCYPHAKPPTVSTATLSPPPPPPRMTLQERLDAAKAAAENKKAAADAAAAALAAKQQLLQQKLDAAKAKREAAAEALKKARAVRDALVAKLTDAAAAKRAKVATDAALAGRNVTRIKASLSAMNSSDACSRMCEKMKVDCTLVACEAKIKPTGRRHLQAAADYDVDVAANPAEVDTTAATAALESEGITPVVSTTDPLKELEAVPGVDAADVENVRQEAAAVTAADAEVKTAEQEAETTKTETDTLKQQADDTKKQSDDAAAALTTVRNEAAAQSPSTVSAAHNTFGRHYSTAATVAALLALAIVSSFQ